MRQKYQLVLLSILATIILLPGIFTNIYARPQNLDHASTATQFLHQSDPQTELLIQSLLEQGVHPDCILGIDPKGIPIVCEPEDVQQRPAAFLNPTNLPSNTRGWNVIPGVIRNDGIETFRVEIDTNGPVSKVTMVSGPLMLLPPQAFPFDLRDDGLGSDQAAGDFIFTSGLFRFDTSKTMNNFYLGDSSSPAGLDVIDVATIEITELNGTTTQFLIGPQIGLLRADIPDTSFVVLAPDLVVAPHLINISSEAHATQRFLHASGLVLMPDLTQRIYELLPDVFDFLVFFSTNKIERLPRTNSANYVSGMHFSTKVDYTGTGITPYDDTDLYGSGGRLLSINALDAYNRGILSNNATHEITHQWSSFTSQSLGLTDSSGAHYKSRSNAGSLVGGFAWIDNGDGTFTPDCDNGRNGAYHAPPLDKYMMGLLPPENVPTLYVYDDAVTHKCITGDPVLPQEIVNTLTINDIQNVHGERIPGPAEAQRQFAIAFVAESHNRLLNPTELTFYETLAAFYTHQLASQEPDPYVGFNWVSIERYFGEGTVWTSKVISRGVELDPQTSTRYGNYGATVTHTLQVTNTGTLSDTYDILLDGNVWLTTAPDNVGPLTAGATGEVEVTVYMPANSGSAINDQVVVTIASQNDSAQAVSAVLTTVLEQEALFLPIIMR